MLLSAGMLISGFSLSAQQVWTLEDCVNYAIENNIDIKKQVLMVENREADLLQSKLMLLPDLNAGGNHIYNWGQTVDRYTNTFATDRVQSNNFYLSSSFTIFYGLRKMNTMKQSELEMEAAQYDLDYLMDDISLAVAGFYLDILFNEKLLEVANEQLKVTRLQVNRMKKLVDAGSMAKGDLLNIQAQAATEELQVTESENRLMISYLNLQQLIDYPVSAEFRIETPELRAIEAPSISITSDDIYNTAVGNRPEIKSAESRVQSAEKGIGLARGYMSPVLSLNGSWATGYSGASVTGSDPFIELSNTPVGQTSVSQEIVLGYDYGYNNFNVVPWDTQIKDNQNKTVGLTLNVPIFNGWQVRTAISKARIAMEDAEYSLEQTKLNLNKVIQQSYVDALASLKQYNSATKKVEAQGEAFKYAEKKFDIGMMNSVDYNEIKKELTRAESELLQAKFNYIYKTTILNFYMGRPLSLN